MLREPVWLDIKHESFDFLESIKLQRNKLVMKVQTNHLTLALPVWAAEPHMHRTQSTKLRQVILWLLSIQVNKNFSASKIS